MKEGLFCQANMNTVAEILMVLLVTLKVIKIIIITLGSLVLKV